jgi:hypothetical protein
MPEPSAPAFFLAMKTRTFILLALGFAVLVFAGVVVRDTRATQRKAARLQAVMQAAKPGQELSPDLTQLIAEDPESFRTMACRFKPQGMEQCAAIRFLLENTWQQRLYLAPRKVLSGQIIVADGNLEAYDIGFGQAGRMVINVENRQYTYFLHIPAGNPVLKPTDAYFFLAPGTSDQERAAALDWDVGFLTDLRTVQNGQELLKSHSR